MYGVASMFSWLKSNWSCLGQRIIARSMPSVTVQDLERALLKVWNRISQKLIEHFVASMENRYTTDLAEWGDNTFYYKFYIIFKQHFFLHLIYTFLGIQIGAFFSGSWYHIKIIKFSSMTFLRPLLFIYLLWGWRKRESLN